MKRILSLLFIACLFIQHATPEPWGGAVITLTTNTGIRIVKTRTIVSELRVQVANGVTHVAYLLYADPSLSTCNKGDAGVILIKELAAGSSGVAGGDVSITSAPDNEGLDAHGYCVEGTTSDTVNVAFNKRN